MEGTGDVQTVVMGVIIGHKLESERFEKKGFAASRATCIPDHCVGGKKKQQLPVSRCWAARK